MCHGIGQLYPDWTCGVEQTKIAELIVGDNRKEAEIRNIVEFAVGMLDMCGLHGDAPTKWAYIGDTLVFYKQTYIAKTSFLPIRLN